VPLNQEQVASPIKKKKVIKSANNGFLGASDLSQIQLPSTGIDLPFYKKRPTFIKDAPTIEMTH